MNCKRIEKELSAYLDGEVQGARLRQVEQHLAECDACRVRLARLRQTAALVAAVPQVAPPADLAARVFAQVAPERAPAMSCAEACQQVHAYADGWLAPATVARLEAHLRDCPQCEAELRRVRAVKEAAASLPEVAPPPTVRQTVAAAMAAHQARSRRTTRRWVWGAVGTTAAAAAAYLLTLTGGPQPQPGRDSVANVPNPPAAVDLAPAPSVGDAGATVVEPPETAAPATQPSLIGRVVDRVVRHHDSRMVEPRHAPEKPEVLPAPMPAPTGNGEVTVAVGPGEAPEPVTAPTDNPPDAAPEVFTVAAVPPPGTPETDAWEAVGVRKVPDEPRHREDTVAAAPRSLFRFSQPIQHPDVVISASGHKRRGGPLRGSDGGYVEVAAGSL